MTPHRIEHLLENFCRFAAWLCVASLFFVGVVMVYMVVSTVEITHVRAQATAIGAASLGSLLVSLFAALIAFPIGIGAAIYLEEYAPPGIGRTILRRNVSSSIGIPPILFGLLGFTLLDPLMDRGPYHAMFAIALVLAAIVLPHVTWSTQQALRIVPRSVRRQSYALGATRWQTVWRQVLPSAITGIGRGAALAAARVAGQTAPLMVLFGMTGIGQTTPDSLGHPTILSVDAYRWLTVAEYGPSVAVVCIMVLVIGVLAVLLTGSWQRQDDTIHENTIHDG